ERLATVDHADAFVANILDGARMGQDLAVRQTNRDGVHQKVAPGLVLLDRNIRPTLHFELLMSPTSRPLATRQRHVNGRLSRHLDLENPEAHADRVDAPNAGKTLTDLLKRVTGDDVVTVLGIVGDAVEQATQHVPHWAANQESVRPKRICQDAVDLCRAN